MYIYNNKTYTAGSAAAGSAAAAAGIGIFSIINRYTLLYYILYIHYIRYYIYIYIYIIGINSIIILLCIHIIGSAAAGAPLA